MSLQNESGVVNSLLQVYGTTNVRVADLSILPVHVSAHPQSLACSSLLALGLGSPPSRGNYSSSIPMQMPSLKKQPI